LVAGLILVERLAAEQLSVPGGLGADSFLAADHGALARVVHGQMVEQAEQSENSVYGATLAAYERERAVLGLKSPECIEENVHPGRVHERDLEQIHDDRTGSVVENAQQTLPQHGRGPEVDFPMDTEHRCVLIISPGR
jgi:hypothetical protein